MVPSVWLHVSNNATSGPHRPDLSFVRVARHLAGATRISVDKPELSLPIQGTAIPGKQLRPFH